MAVLEKNNIKAHRSVGIATSDHLMLELSSLPESDSGEMHKHHLLEESESSRDIQRFSSIPVQNAPSTTDSSELPLYLMKASESRKGPRARPSKIKFQKVHSLDKIPRKRRTACHCEECHRCLMAQKNGLSVPKVPSQMSQKSGNDQLTDKPPPIRSKFRNMFSLFCSQSDKTQQHHADVETGLEIDDEDNAEFYHFDHGSPLYYQTTDSLPRLRSEAIAERIYDISNKFWAEVFGSLNVVVVFFITFILQLYRFILYSLLRAIITGLFKITSDYLLKPTLAVAFNGVLQPLLIFAQNVFQSITNMVKPLTELMCDLVKPLAHLLGSFRLVEIKKLKKEIREEPIRHQTLPESNA